MQYLRERNNRFEMTRIYLIGNPVRPHPHSPCSIGFNGWINSFHATGLFLYPLKTLENQRFFDVFREYRKRAVV